MIRCVGHRRALLFVDDPLPAPEEVHPSSPSSSLAINNRLYPAPAAPFPLPRQKRTAIRAQEVITHAKRPTREPMKKGMVVGKGKMVRMVKAVRRVVRRAMRRAGCIALGEAGV
jgi:hypothetical protein